MKLTTFAIVTTFFALVVANPATDNVGDNLDDSGCKGQVCYNSRTGISSPCCTGSYCNYGVGFISVCA